MTLAGLDKFYAAYFLLHIPITVLIDSSLVIPPAHRPLLQQQILKFHFEQNKDFLLVNVRNWLWCFGIIEMVFQLPFFAWAAYRLLGRKGQMLTLTMAPGMILYGFNASVTSLVCIVEIVLEGARNGLTQSEVWALVGVYFPTFVIPFVMLLVFTVRI
ncbi:hypothetical protein BABINDRAFT_170629 [Babjeviella inositovora NRRL Y-12698]|uniref:Efficient mitochondria targeting-associated protein 19 n=1 Tax=Babjeviella inositovora NRRL Y-12698 TaxID=984486 RepID=A0A1E3QX49_9ASCO|nr:uncharacterized protein BABINDRAFT_170629 [Babjeviella inositovora NRRL Y-12698]ODQ82094.1 hypothetical protein BABINDRAFT_170629 [Babjeviella inositovora NRRL Y-12698]